MVKKTSSNFSPAEQRIMRLLYQTKVRMTAYEISKKIGVTFPTAKKYLKLLVEKNAIIYEDEEYGRKEKKQTQNS